MLNLNKIGKTTHANDKKTNKQPILYLQFQVHRLLRDIENNRKESNDFYPINIVRPVHLDSPGGAEEFSSPARASHPQLDPAVSAARSRARHSQAPSHYVYPQMTQLIRIKHVQSCKHVFYGGNKTFIPILASLLQCFYHTYSLSRYFRCQKAQFPT